MTAQAMDNGRPLNNNDEAMTLTEHLGELRRRILHSLAALAAGTLEFCTAWRRLPPVRW